MYPRLRMILPPSKVYVVVYFRRTLLKEKLLYISRKLELSLYIGDSSKPGPFLQFIQIDDDTLLYLD